MYFYNFVILLVICFVLYLYWRLKKSYEFFEKLGVPYLKPNLIFGNMLDVILLRKSLAEIYVDFYRQLEPYKFGGVFTFQKPTIIIRDPELLKDVLIKDFAFMSDRGFHVDPEVEPLSNHLFTMRGDEWKNARIKLTNTFTSGKIKIMFPLVKSCGEKLSEVIGQIPLNKSFDIKDISARYTTDIIGTCAFGIETNSLLDPNSEFRMLGKKVFEFRIQSLLRILWMRMPVKLTRLLHLTYVDLNVQNYFGDIVYKTINYREKHKVTRNDFLDLLIALKNDSNITQSQDTKDREDLQTFLDQIGADKGVKCDIKMTNELIAAQAFLFFAAGFETSSTTLSYILLELAQNQSIQNRVRAEIQTVLSANNGDLTYDVLKKMTYTDMVICETLRKYPPAATLFRRINRNYRIPNTKAIIPADTPVVIPVYGIHLDEKYYDNPQQFRPERFTEQEKAKRPNYTYLPFGEGPRTCIAKRFAKMNVKIGLVYALKNQSYRVSSEMKFPIKFERNFGLLTARNSIWLEKH